MADDNNPVDGVYPYQRGPGAPDLKTLRVTLASGTVFDLPAGAATSANQLTSIDLLAQILDGVTHISIDADSVNLNVDELEARVGPTNEAAPATTDGAAGLNGLLRFLIKGMPLLVAGKVPITADQLPLPAGAATEAKQDAQIVLETQAVASVGLPTDAPAPANDSAASVIAILKRLCGLLPGLINGELPVTFDWPVEASTLAEQKSQTASLEQIKDNTAAEPRNTSVTVSVPVEGQATAAGDGIVTPIASSTTLVQSVVVAGRMSARDDNAGVIWLGFSNVPGSQRIKIEQGGEYEVSAAAGEKLDLNKLYFQAEVAGDGASIVAIK